MQPLIAVLEDDADLRAIIARALVEHEFRVKTLATGRDLMRMVGTTTPAAVVVDIGLPDGDGRDVVQALRANGVGAPVIFLTARDALPDRLSGFAAGGDDYLTKPFAVSELVARLCVLVRRSGINLAVGLGGLRLDPVTHAVSSRDRAVELTPTEFRILGRLTATPGAAVRRRDLIAAGWPHGAIVHDNTLDVYIARLRRKLRDLPDAPALVTVHGIGYSVR